MIDLFNHLYPSRECSYNIRYYIFSFLSLFLVIMIFSQKYTEITKEFMEYRLLRESLPKDSEISTIPFNIKTKILNNFIRETYQGTWTISSNNTSSKFTSTTGDIEIIFPLLQGSKVNNGLYYNYDIILFERHNDNSHSITIKNSFAFSLYEHYPSITYDNHTNIVSLSNQMKSIVNEYDFLYKKSEDLIQVGILLQYEANSPEMGHDKELSGELTFDDTVFTIVLSQHHPTVYQSMTIFSVWLIILGSFQCFYLKLLNDKFIHNQSEALKYCPYTFIINGLFNGAIGFGCFLAALIDEKMYYSFIVPSAIYFILFVFFDVKIIIYVWIIQENDPRRGQLQSSEKVKSKLMNFCIFFCITNNYLYLIDVLLIALFIYSFDLFFWKSINYIVITMTFLPQIIFGLKRRVVISWDFVTIISLNKLFIPIYFRTAYNFLRFQRDYFFIMKVIGIILIEIAIMYIEMYVNRNIIDNESVVMRQKRRRKIILADYTKTIHELQTMHIEIDNVQCSICLGDLIEKKRVLLSETNENMSVKYDKTIAEQCEDFNIKDESLYNINNAVMNHETTYEKEDLTLFNNNSSLQNKETPNQSTETNKTDIKLILTQCHHLFHIKCLKKWLKVKYICPQCRGSID